MADYHALPEDGASVTRVSGNGNGHGFERSSSHQQPPPEPRKARMSTHATATATAHEDGDETALEVALVPALGEPRPLPAHFLARGYRQNSYFSGRLLNATLVLAVLTACGITAFWVSTSIARGGVYVSDVGAALRFQALARADCDDDAEYCGKCDSVVSYAMLVYHAVPLLLLIGLPASGLRVFDPFKRDSRHASFVEAEDGREKLQRSLFFQFCELLGVCVLGINLLVVIYFIYAIVQGDNFHCSHAWPIVYVLGAVVCFLGTFVVLTFFARFREHLKMQLGAFKESDQTGGIRSRLVQRGSEVRSEHAQIVDDLRKKLFKETELGNVHKMEEILSSAQQQLGPDFADAMYASPRIVLKFFGRSKKNPMHMAAYLGNIHALDLLLKAGFNINSYDKVSRVRFTTGDLFWTFAQFFVSKPITSEDETSASMFRTTLVTPLHCAVSTGQISTVQWLIDHDADVNLKSKSSYWSDRLTPLFLADNPEIVSMLLEAGANHLEIPDPGRMNTLTVLQMAYLRGNFPVAHELERWGADVALTPLHEAAADNDLTAVKKLLKAGADPNCVGEQGYTGMHRRTPLHWAAINGSMKCAVELLERGSDPNFQDVFGRSPLHWAARVNRPEMVKLLLTSGADPNLRDFRDKTPILCAASSRDVTEELFESITEHGANINDCLPNGDTALHIALKCEQKKTALALLDSGADIMVINNDGYRPLDCTTSTQLQFEIKRAAGDRDVMISYTHSHREFALKLRDCLERANITAWLDLST
jgi:ankyrin repeat protein